MAFDPLRTGFATLEFEIAEERVSALGRLGRNLETALTALAACEETDPQLRAALIKEARHSLWLFVVQREACGLNNSAQLINDYRIPREIYEHLELQNTYKLKFRRRFAASR